MPSKNRTRSCALTPVLLLLLFAFAALPAALAQGPQFSDKIEPDLLDRFATEGTADFVVRFAEQADLSPAYTMSWQERGEFVVRVLTEAAQRSQTRAKALLESRGLHSHTFIAGNELYVWAGDLSSAQALAALPEVALIYATRTYHIDPILPLDPPPEPAPQALAWGIVDTHADDFWTQFGVQGDGIVVANIDTGVQWNHPALDQAYKCPGNPGNSACWYDPSNICGGTPCDNNGHGTHTMGTMVGDDDPTLTWQAGMAPNAQWIACKGCESSSCSTFALNACADWILAPGGSSANRPHVVNNSWGGPGCDTWYQAKVQAWRAAGIFPAFSAGNDGPSCSTLGSPGIYQVSFASAAHASSRTIASFSSRGPAPGGSCPPYTPYTKPNISAPGVNVCSSIPTNSWSCAYSGTSMASPHSAGAVALLWSCNPGLIGQIDQTFELLQNHADSPPAGTCGAPPNGQGNYTYGYGYLNVLAAGQAACGILQAPTLYDPGEYSTSGNYTVDWSDVSGATSYLLQEDDNPSFSSPTEYTTSSSQYAFTGKADGYYYYRVAAKSGSQTSPWSNTVDIIVDKTPPTNPSSVWSTSHTPYTWSTDNTIDVSWSGAWDALSGVYGYSIEWSTSPDTLPDTTVDTTGSSTTSPPLADGNSWYFHLRTRDVAGNWNAGAVHLGP
ncbi:MAG: S8 family serine peptidase, partial [Chloroflexia bacterium]